jgi:hypothetical protein
MVPLVAVCTVVVDMLAIIIANFTACDVYGIVGWVLRC